MLDYIKYIFETSCKLFKIFFNIEKGNSHFYLSLCFT